MSQPTGVVGVGASRSVLRTRPVCGSLAPPNAGAGGLCSCLKQIAQRLDEGGQEGQIGHETRAWTYKKLPKPRPSPERRLEDAEFAALRELLDNFDQLVVDVLVATRMRMGEAQGLHKAHTDLKRKVVQHRIGRDREGCG